MKKVDVKTLMDIVGKDNVKDDPADLYIYGSDASVHAAAAWAVVRPETAAHVQGVMRYANAKKIPVIARGSGSEPSLVRFGPSPQIRSL